MSIEVYGSDDLSDLSSALHDSLQKEIKEREGLYSPIVIIPNKSMETWLYLDLVRRSGIAFNLRFLFLEKLLEELLLRKFSPEIDPNSRPFLQNETRKLQIYSTLLRNPQLSNRYPILKAYLFPEDRKTPDPSRLLELSGRIAKYFKDYELHRQDWIHNWTGEKYSLLRIPGEDIWEEVATQSEIFFFQKELYSQLISENPEQETLIQYSMRTLSEKKEVLPLHGTVVHLFALSQLSSTYIAIFQNLLPEASLRIYQFGVPRDESISGLERKQICRNWANPFRSLKNVWHKVGANFFDFDTRAGIRSVSVLKGFQNYLMYGSGPAERMLPDESLVILETSGKQREVEAVFQRILGLLSDSPETKLTDIGIFCADLGEYRPAIEIVFEGGLIAKTGRDSTAPKTLPYTIRDVLAKDTSQFTNGILSLFPILSGQRSRADLFRLFRNPCFQAKWEIDSSIVEEWSSYAIELELFQDDSREEEDPQSFSFRKGFLRLAAGSLIPDEDTDFPFAPFDVGSDSGALWIGIWEKVSESLKRFRDQIYDPNIPGSVLLDSFRDLVFGILVSGSTESETDFEIAFGESILNLGTFDWDPKNPKDRIRFLESFVKQSAEEIQVRKGKYLTGGVTVSSLQPMRPIPFDHIFVMGLGEGIFPGSDDKSAFNLRYLSPREGDIGARSLNESLLYETILSARKSIALSFVSEDPKNEESIAPSSSLLLMEQALKENILVPESSIRVKIPLNKHSKEYFFPSVQKGSSHTFLRTFDLSSSLIHGNDGEKSLYQEKILGLHSSGRTIREKTDPIIPKREVDWNELVRFARSPLSYHLRKNFGLYLDEIGDGNSQSEEPFRIGNPFRFYSDLWREYFQKPDLDLTASMKSAFRQWEREGTVPRGVYRDAEFLTKLQKIRNISDSLGEILPVSARYSGLSFGETRKQGSILILPEIEWNSKEHGSLTVHGLKENIIGRKEEDGTVSIFFIYPNSSRKLKNLIEPFLLQCLLDCSEGLFSPKSASAVFGYGEVSIVLSMNRKGEEKRRREFLDNLISEFLKPKSSLVSPKLWEEFPDRRNSVSETEEGRILEFANEYSVWAKESVQSDPEGYLDPVLRLLAHPEKYITKDDFFLSLKIYEPVMSVFHVEK